MSKVRTQSPSVDPIRSAEEHARALAQILQGLEAEGDASGARKAVGTIREALALPEDAFASRVAAADGKAKELREQLGEQLRDAARQAGAEFLYQPPNVRFGCVNLREKRAGLWELSVLDFTVIETVRSGSASVIAAAAIRRIEEIESALSQASVFVEDLKSAVEAVRDAGAESDGVSPNLLMLLCTHRRALKKHLVSAEGAGGGQLSRPQMGFLLRRVSQLEGTAPRFRLRPATQHVTKDPSRFIPVPRDVDPRRGAEFDPIATVTLDVEKRA